MAMPEDIPFTRDTVDARGAPEALAPVGRSAVKLASSTFLPGTDALSLSGESSATSSPWSTIAMRSHSLSASSM